MTQYYHRNGRVYTAQQLAALREKEQSQDADTDLLSVKGVGPSILERLKAAGVDTVQKLKGLNQDTLKELVGPAAFSFISSHFTNNSK